VNLRTRIALAGGAVVFAALTVVSLVLYPVLASKVRAQLEASLVAGADAAPDTIGKYKQKLASEKTPPESFPDGPIAVGSALLQVIVDPTAPGAGASFAPVSDSDLAVLTGQAAPYFSDVSYRGQVYRVYTSAPDKILMRVARPDSDEAGTLNRLLLWLVGLTVVGGVVAALAARLAAGRVLRPVGRLMEAVEHVTATQELTARVATGGRDEIGRLARSFAAMMAALEGSVRAQRQLVADASHELRTPLTSLTTNLELLSEPGGSADPQAPALLRAAREQVRELTGLVNDLVDLARYGETETHLEEARLDLLAERAVHRAARHAPAVRFELDLAASHVWADTDALERAIGNLIDNAVKWSPPGGRVRVVVTGGDVAVSDEGPGIPAADLPFIFDRFYRSPTARARPGSGLGLAIVRQIAETHGGRISAEPRPRGVCLRLSLPAVPEAVVLEPPALASSDEPGVTH
jgi:two-component system sensor histidine kinase MprB